MLQYNFDASEYQQPSSARYASEWDTCADLSPAFFKNEVSYFSDEKKLYLNICSTYEFETLLGFYCDLELPTPIAYQDDPKVEEVERWRKARQELLKKFGPAFGVRMPPPLYPHESSERKINAFSGTEVSVPLGEGLLNFCYADFNSTFEHCMPAYRELTQSVDTPAKIHSAEEGIIRLYELYAEIFPTLSDVFYASLYTACFPPQFTRKTVYALEYYQQYVSFLQTEFLELIEFCLDKEFRPEVLGQLYPSERYALWGKIKGVPASHIRQETFQADSYEPHGTVMPFGADLGDPDRPLSLDIPLTPEQKEFARKYGLPEHILQLRYTFHCFISTSYACESLKDMLFLEFTKILETGVEFQKCKRCGRYFIVKGNYHGVYCDRIPEGEHRTCQQLAAQETYLSKLRDNNGENPLNVYQKYYKRYFARVKAGSLKEKKFRQWQYEAVRKRDACLSGAMPLGEFKDWLEVSMPNRTKKER